MGEASLAHLAAAAQVIQQRFQFILHGIRQVQETAADLHLFAQQARLMRIYEGPTEVHRMAIAKRVLRRGAAF